MSTLDKYFSIPKDSRWLYSPTEFSGRYIEDVAQIYCSIESRVKEIWDINEVPEEFVIRLKMLKAASTQIEELTCQVVDIICDYNIAAISENKKG